MKLGRKLIAAFTVFLMVFGNGFFTGPLANAMPTTNGAIRVTKEVDGTKDANKFKFSLTRYEYDGKCHKFVAVPGSTVSMTDRQAIPAGESFTFTNLPCGFYKVEEIGGMPAGYADTPTVTADRGTTLVSGFVQVKGCDTQKVTVTNKKLKGKVTVKKDILNYSSERDFSFTITGGPGKIDWEFEVDEDDPKELWLEYGTYTITECTDVTDPTYTLFGIRGGTPNLETRSTQVTVDSTGCTEVVFQNLKHGTGKVTVCKDIDGRAKGEPYDGAAFGFTLTGTYTRDHKTVTVFSQHGTVSPGHPAVFEDLPYGDYTVVEDAQPADSGYVNGRVDGGKFTLKSSNADKNVCATIHNTKRYSKGELTIRKAVDGRAEGEPSDGAAFTVDIVGVKNGVTVYRETGLTLSEAAPITRTHLPYGHYEVTESAPSGDSGYAKVSDGSFDINDSTAKAAVNVTITNRKLYSTGKVIIQKAIDGRAEGEPSDGAAFTVDVTGVKNGVTVYSKTGLPLSEAAAVELTGLPYGHYTVTENAPAADSGYTNDGAPVEFDINGETAAATLTYTLHNTKLYSTGEVTVAKAVDEKTAEGDDPGSFPVQITGTSNGVVVFSRTGAVGEGAPLKLTGLPYGHYVVHESGDIPGYENGPDIAFDINDSTREASFTVTLRNTKLYGVVTVAKAFQGVNTDPDAAFTVRIQGVTDPGYENVVTLRGGAVVDSTLPLDRLPFGNVYRVAEDAKAGYETVGITVNGETVADNRFTVTGTEEIAIVVTNRQLGALTVKKVVDNYDGYTGEHPAPSFKVRITRQAPAAEAGAAAPIEVLVPANDPDGVVIPNLPYGTYTVEELQGADMPAGYEYVSISKEEFTIDDEGKTDEIVLTNRGYADLVIAKYDSRSRDAEEKIGVPGVTFEVYSTETADGKETRHVWLADGVTGDDGLLTVRLPVGGTYYVHEIQPADGYNLFPDDVQSAALDVAPGGVKAGPVFYNDPIGRIVIRKLDSQTGEALPDGVEFGIYATEEAALADAGNDGAGALQKVKTADGAAASGDLILTGDSTTFFVKELSEPENYRPNHAVYPVTIAFEDRLTAAALDVRDDPLGRIKITKTTTGGAPLAGASFVITTDDPTDGKAAEDAFTVKVGPTQADGTVTSGDLLALKDGVYWVYEDAAPAGYIKSDEVKEVRVVRGEVVEVAADGSPLTFRNTQYGRLTVKKTDSLTGEALAGAKFELYDSAMKLVARGETDENGLLTFEGLVPSAAGTTYWLVETAAPKDYLLDGDPRPVAVKEGDNTLPVTNEYSPKDVRTGMMDYNILLIGGAALLAGVLLVVFTRRRRAAVK